MMLTCESSERASKAYTAARGGGGGGGAATWNPHHPHHQHHPNTGGRSRDHNNPLLQYVVVLPNNLLCANKAQRARWLSQSRISTPASLSAELVVVPSSFDVDFLVCAPSSPANSWLAQLRASHAQGKAGQGERDVVPSSQLLNS